MSNATATLSKATDTPKARKAPATPKAPSDAVTVSSSAATIEAPVPTAAKTASIDTVAFLAATYKGQDAVSEKVRVIGDALASGSTNADITKSLSSALRLACLDVPKSFSASITHYATAAAVCNTVHYYGNNDARYAAYSISTGVVKAKAREEMVSNFSGTVFDFIAECARLVSEARAAKKAPAADKADEADEAEETAPETISPLDDVRALIRQAGKLLELLESAEDSTDYYSALSMFEEFHAYHVDTETDETE